MGKTNKNNLVLRFIELYRSHEVLWNMNLSSYRRNDLKIKAYEAIAADMKMSVPDVKKKIKSLRTAYSAEKLKVDKSIKFGCGTDSAYTPTVFWYNDMTFLNSYLIRRSTVDDSNQESVCSNDVNYDPLPRSYEYIDVKSDMPRKSSSTTAEKSQIIHTPKSATENMLAYAVRHMDREDDEYLLMARTYAMKLKKMEPLQRLYADRIINEVLMEGQLGTLDRYTSIVNTDAQEQHIETSRDMMKGSPEQY